MVQYIVVMFHLQNDPFGSIYSDLCLGHFLALRLVLVLGPLYVILGFGYSDPLPGSFLSPLFSFSSETFGCYSCFLSCPGFSDF